jgi:hypothetical protein
MRSRENFILRVLADLIVGIVAVFGLIAASHSPKTIWVILVLIWITAGALAGGFYETSAKRVWIHAPVMMILELVALPYFIVTCRGFECGSLIAVLIFVNLGIPVLVCVSFAGFFLRRYLTRMTVH